MKEEIIILHGVYRRNSCGRAYLFLLEAKESGQRIWPIKNGLPLANGQNVCIEGIAQGKYLYVKKAHVLSFPRRERRKIEEKQRKAG